MDATAGNRDGKDRLSTMDAPIPSRTPAHATLAGLYLMFALAMPFSSVLALEFPSQAFAKDGGGHGGSGGGSGGSGSSGSGHGGSGHGGSGSSGNSSGHGGSSGEGSSGHGSGHESGHSSSGGSNSGSDDGAGGGRGKGSEGKGGRSHGPDGGRNAVVWSSRNGEAVEVRYGDGWSERADASHYTLRDPDRRVVAERPARGKDLTRLRALAE